MEKQAFILTFSFFFIDISLFFCCFVSHLYYKHKIYTYN